MGGEDAAERCEGLGEFLGLDCAEAVEVEVTEDAADGLAFIVGAVGLLADFFENDCFELSDTLLRDS